MWSGVTDNTVFSSSFVSWHLEIVCKENKLKILLNFKAQIEDRKNESTWKYIRPCVKSCYSA